MLKIIIGYVLTLGYAMSLILLLAPAINRRFGLELSRKVVHTLLFFVWVFIDLFFKASIHQIIIPVIFVVLNTLSYKLKLFKSLEREGDNPPGTVYFAIAITITQTLAYFFPSLHYPSGVAAACLTFGDGLAAIIGKQFKSRKLRNNKTLNGSLSCFASSFAALCIFYAVYLKSLPLLPLLSIALLTAIMELTDYGIDNFSIVFGSFSLSYAFMVLPQESLIIAALIAEVVFIIVFASDAFDYCGALISMLMVFCYSYFGGIFSLTCLLCMYFTVFLISKLKSRFFNHPKSKDRRNAWQVLINGGFALVFIIIYGLNHNDRLLIVALVSVGACFADSISSDVGTLSKREPFDILSWKKVPTGLSGGVSLLGMLSTAVAAAALALAIALYTHSSAYELLLMFVLIFSQSILDSVLGSSLQLKHRCEKCGLLCDEAWHCGAEAKKVGGMKHISNNSVNLISSTIITALAFLLLA